MSAISFIHSFIHSFIYLFVYLFAHLLANSFVRLFVSSLVRSLVRSFSFFFVRPSVRLLACMLYRSFVCLLILVLLYFCTYYSSIKAIDLYFILSRRANLKQTPYLSNTLISPRKLICTLLKNRFRYTIFCNAHRLALQMW